MTTTETRGHDRDPRRRRPDRRLTTAKAMVEGIAQEMERDPSVFVLGEDVGAYGGIFCSTTGLLDRFGPRPGHGHADLGDGVHRRWPSAPRSRACGRSSS